MAAKNAVTALVKLVTLAKTVQEKIMIMFYKKEAEHGFLPS